MSVTTVCRFLGMPLLLVQFLIAIISSFVAVTIGSGGDVLFLSGVLFLAPLIAHHYQSTFSVGTLVATQGIVGTFVGGIAYFRTSDIPTRDLVRAIGAVVIGSLGSSFVAYLLPSRILQAILAIAITAATVRVFFIHKAPVGRHKEGSKGLNWAILISIFFIAALTGGLGVGGGFLFFIALLKLKISGSATRGFTLILTFTNLVTSFFGHLVHSSVSGHALEVVAFGALLGSLFASLFLTGINERVARWGLRILLIGSAAMSWMPIWSYKGL